MFNKRKNRYVESERNVNLEIYDIDKKLITKINCDEFSMFEENYSGNFCYSVGYVVIDNKIIMKLSYLIGCTKVVKEGIVKVVVANK